MKKILIIFLLLFGQHCYSNTSPDYEWAVIGAGPAGITTVAVLLELHINPATIVWIDPEFNVGRMGKYYRNVPGNLQTFRLTTYINGCSLFTEFPCPVRDTLFTYDPQEFQPLHIMIDPMIEVTNYLRKKINAVTATVSSLDNDSGYWKIFLQDTSIQVKKVILATGSHPKRLSFDIPEISLDLALDKETLAFLINSKDSIAVFGGMHSAILVLKNLHELNVHQIINFYSSQFFYGMPGTLGLEGITARWAKQHLENNLPENLIRVCNSQDNLNTYLPCCNKVIYAIGYERNSILVNGKTELSFDINTGIVDHRLYGIGVAFAPFATLENGKTYDLNGFNTYLGYAKELVPKWMAE